MSFSTEVKNNLARIIPETKEQQISELSGIIRMGGNIRFVGNGLLSFVITIENPAVSRKIIRIIKTNFHTDVQIRVNRNENLRKRFYTLEIPDKNKSNDILVKTGILEKEENWFRLTSKISEHILQSEKNTKAYIRGAFIGGGSIADPDKFYHLEFVTGDDEFSEYFKELLNSQNLSANVTKRKNNNVIYIKDSNQISALLSLMGDFENTFLIENIKLTKQIRNKVNRLVNCETANLDRTVSSAAKQIESIEYIEKTVGFSKLPEDLREVAVLRQDNPYASLKELSELSQSPLGRSVINYRLKKIQKFAEKLKKKRK